MARGREKKNGHEGDEFAEFSEDTTGEEKPSEGQEPEKPTEPPPGFRSSAGEGSSCRTCYHRLEDKEKGITHYCMAVAGAHNLGKFPEQWTCDTFTIRGKVK